ncbi:DEP domain-containing protein 1B-like [Styela clava]
MAMETYTEDQDYKNCSVKNRKSENKAFKATKTWNTFVKSFELQICCCRNRKNLKIYKECFTGSSAVTTMHKILKEMGNYENVSRSQGIKLLQNFMDQHIIEDINEKWLSEEFKDSGKLYRLAERECSNASKKWIENRSQNRSNSIHALVGRKVSVQIDKTQAHFRKSAKRFSISSVARWNGRIKI